MTIEEEYQKRHERMIELDCTVINPYNWTLEELDARIKEGEK